MVAIARDLRRLIAQQEEGRWNHEPISGTELYGKRVGIVGYGATGRYLATDLQGARDGGVGDEAEAHADRE